MATRRVILDVSADAEAEQAYDEYAKHSARAADGFRIALREAIRRVAEGAETFPAYDGEARRCLLRKYPFGVIYEVTGDVVFVVAIAHLKRRPGYWK